MAVYLSQIGYYNNEYLLKLGYTSDKENLQLTLDKLKNWFLRHNNDNYHYCYRNICTITNIIHSKYVIDQIKKIYKEYIIEKSVCTLIGERHQDIILVPYKLIDNIIDSFINFSYIDNFNNKDNKLEIKKIEDLIDITKDTIVRLPSIHESKELNTELSIYAQLGRDYFNFSIPESKRITRSQSNIPKEKAVVIENYTELKLKKDIEESDNDSDYETIEHEDDFELI